MDLPFDITLAQLNPCAGALDDNFAQIKDTLDQNQNTDLVVFPECITTGYPVDDLVLNDGFMRDVHAHIDRLIGQTADHPCGYILPTPYKQDGVLYNAALLIEGGKILSITKKQELPNTGVFDEKRIFTPSELQSPITFRGHKIGLMICEDMWHVHPAKHLKDNGAEFLIVVNGSPYQTDIDTLRLQTATARTTENSLPLLYVNLIGGQDELVFDGNSFAMDKAGKITARLPAFKKTVSKIADMTNPPPLSKEEEIYTAATMGLRDYIQKTSFNGVLIGLSGGIDSALTAVMAVDAIGADNVHCVMMPSEFTSGESLEDAKQCAKNLGVKYDIIPIKDGVSALQKTLSDYTTPDTAPIAFENLQSRLRGLTLMTLSNATGKIVLSTGNKSEVAVGYATLYGDMCGAYNPLKDLYKTQVFALSNWRNKNGEVIPTRIITKPPSAELRPDQKDEDSLPPYEILDDILECLIEKDMAPTDIKHDPETVNHIWKLLNRAEYKRRQATPGPKTTPKAFGRDRRYPITNGYFKTVKS